MNIRRIKMYNETRGLVTTTVRAMSVVRETGS